MKYAMCNEEYDKYKHINQNENMKCSECYFLSEVNGEFVPDCERYGKCELEET